MVNHPIAYALAAVFAVGFAVFQYISHKQKEQEQRSGRSRPRRPPSPPGRPPSPPRKFDQKPKKPDDKPGKPDHKPGKPNDKPTGKPDDKSRKNIGDSCDKPGKQLENSTKSNSSPSSNNENSVRYRIPHSERLNESKQEESNTTALKSNAKNPIIPQQEDRKVSDSEETPQTSSGFIKNELQNSSVNDACNENMDEKNYEKNVFDRLVSETKCINKDPKEEIKLSNNNILEDSESDSDSDNDEFSDFASTGAEGSHQAVCPTEDSENEKNQKKEDEMKEAYKQEVTDKLKRDIGDGCEETASGGNAFGDVNIEEVRSRILDNMNQKKCSGCEEKPCDAVVLPCEHCYLCKDCAKIVIKCSPKCSICLADIKDFR